MKTNALLETLSDFFVSYLPDTKGLSENTIISYQYAFQLLFEFLEAKKGLQPDNVTFKSLLDGTVLEFLSWLQAERGCSPSTRNQRRAAIASFAKYAAKKNLTESLPFYTEISKTPKKKTPKTPDIKYFTKDEIAILMSMPDTKTSLGKRDAVLLSVLYASGARAQELCDLKVNDIYFGAETNLKFLGKGKKTRMATIPDNCATLLSGYLAYRNLNMKNAKDRLKYVFPSQTHEQMSISCVEEIVKKYVAKAKEQHPDLYRRSSYSPHSFRHSIAVHMLECGESLVVIKAFLGHASIASTVHYASVTPELANKYLRERGKPIESVDIDNSCNPRATLPFLNRFQPAKI
jgi:site-specific recombinase XerD